MKPEDRLEDIVRKGLDAHASDGTYARMRDIVLAAQEASRKTKPPIARRLIMSKPIVRFAVAAVIVAAVILGLFEFLGAGSKSGVVWAEVARKVQASRGVVFRNTEHIVPDAYNQAVDFSMNRYTGTQSRLDKYKGGEIITTIYGDCNTKTVILVDHNHKSYVKMVLEKTMPDRLRTADPNNMIQKFLSCKHTELGQKTIDGVLCEGIETTDPAFHGGAHPPESLAARVWVSVETGYPVRMEGDYVTDNGQRRSEFIWDQFQWNAELSESLFVPNIPAGYIDISP
jgi:hypothetical protein